MAKLILITGGSRSGKSTHGQKIAENIGSFRTYIATCPVVDEEMDERIRKHKESRQVASWETIEETLWLADALKRAKESSVILVDCLTLWVNNLMYEAQKREERITEDDITRHCANLFEACKEIEGVVIFITNEVGMGIVPGDPSSRLFRDLAGRCNQIIANQADAVIFMISGIPLNIKGG